MSRLEFKEIMKHYKHDIEVTYDYFTGEVESVDNASAAAIFCHTCDEDIICVDNQDYKNYYTDVLGYGI
jgi:hypothetical protein